MRLFTHKNGSVAKAAGVAFLLWCFVIGLASPTEAVAASPQSAVTSSAGVNSPFAIADFDGDRKPDLATVEVERVDSSSNMRYSIRFQLSAGIAQAIGVTAPAGGLHIVPRDVNGDHALDLLVSTAWLHQPVAVLLNDGHGNFTLSDPTAFLGVIWDPESSWTLTSVEIRDAAAAILSRNFSGNSWQSDGVSLPRQLPGLLASFVSHPPVFSVVFFVLGRAPPAVTVHAESSGS
jgi:hypothetical protein